MLKLALALAHLAAPIAAPEPPPAAIGHADACDDAGYCEQFERRYATMPGCQVGLMRDLPAWIAEKPGNWSLRGIECRPANQQRA